MKRTILLITVAFIGLTATAQQNAAGQRSREVKPMLATDHAATSKSSVKSEKPTPPPLPVAVTAENALSADAAKTTKPIEPGSPVLINKYNTELGISKKEYPASNPPVLPNPQQVQPVPASVEEVKTPVQPKPVMQVQKN